MRDGWGACLVRGGDGMGCLLGEGWGEYLLGEGWVGCLLGEGWVGCLLGEG